MSRHSEKEVGKSWGSFDTTVRLCKHAHSKNSVNRYKTLLETLDSSYYKFDEEWRLYKEEMLKKTCKTMDEFNSEEQVDGKATPVHKYNGKFSDEQFGIYVGVRDLLQDALEANSRESLASTDSTEVKVDIEFAIDEIKGDMKSLEENIQKLKLEIDSYDSGLMPVSVAQSYDNLIAKLSQRVETDLKAKIVAKLAIKEESTDPDYKNSLLRVKYSDFSHSMKSILNDCTMSLVKKITAKQTEEKTLSATTEVAEGVGSMSLGYRPKEQVFLEKSKPPKFSGDELDFPEFKRKWSSQVSKAYLPEESELDKLRDAVPRDARDQLYGVITLEEAWSILSQRYGDKLLISKKLKSQLKSIQCTGKSDPERIINLKIKVRNIVTRLESLGMDGALTHDSEFLSAVYHSLIDIE